MNLASNSAYSLTVVQKAKIRQKFKWMNFSKQFSTDILFFRFLWLIALHIKSSQIVPGTSMIRQLFNLFFGGFLLFGPTVPPPFAWWVLLGAIELPLFMLWYLAANLMRIGGAIKRLPLLLLPYKGAIIFVACSRPNSFDLQSNNVCPLLILQVRPHNFY